MGIKATPIFIVSIFICFANFAYGDSVSCFDDWNQEEIMSAETVLDFVDNAKEILKTEPPVVPVRKEVSVYTGKRDKHGKKIFRKAEKIIGKEVALVILDHDFATRIVRFEVLFPSANEKEGTIQNVSPDNCRVARVGGGGVNTNFSVECGEGSEPVLAGLHPLLDYRRFKYWDKKAAAETKQVIYVPYSDDLSDKGVSCFGEAYIRLQIARARNSLLRDKVKSNAVHGMLIADIFDKEIVFYLALIEHIDEDEFREKGPVYTSDKVLVQFATNREDTFGYAISRTGALCLMQIMPSTYSGIRRAYPEARLPKSAREGSCGTHENAIRAAYLVLDEKLASMPEDFKKKFLEDHETYGVYLAAAYNGGGTRAKNLYIKMKPVRLGAVLNRFERFNFRSKESRVLKRETWIFVKKYHDIQNIFSQSLNK